MTNSINNTIDFIIDSSTAIRHHIITIDKKKYYLTIIFHPGKIDNIRVACKFFSDKKEEILFETSSVEELKNFFREKSKYTLHSGKVIDYYELITFISHKLNEHGFKENQENSLIDFFIFDGILEQYQEGFYKELNSWEKDYEKVRCDIEARFQTSIIYI